MSGSRGDTFKAIIAHQPRFHLILLGSLGLALLGSSFMKVNKRGLLLYDTPSAFLVDEKSERLPVRFARGFGEPALARQVAVASTAPVGRTPSAIPLDTAESVGTPLADSPATRLIAPRGSSALASAPEAAAPRTGGLPGIPSSGFMLSPAGPFIANPGSGGGSTPGNGNGGAGNGGNGSDPGTGSGGGNSGGGNSGGGDNSGGNSGSGDNGGGSTGGGDNGGGNTGGGSTGGGDTGGNGGGIDPGDGGGNGGNGGGIDPGDGGGGNGGGDPIDTGGGDAPAVPEPAAWLMMIIGVGALGRMLRRQGDAQSEIALAPVRSA